MEFKKGDMVRYNFNGINEFKEQILTGDICYGKVIEVDDNPYIKNEKMVTYVDFCGKENIIRSIYLEKGNLTFEYLFAVAIRIGNLDNYKKCIEVLLKSYEGILKNNKNNSIFISSRYVIELFDLVALLENNSDLFDKKLLDSALKVRNFIYYSFNEKQKLDVISFYLVNNDLDKLIKEVYFSLEYNVIDEFKENLTISKIDNGFSYSYSGYSNEIDDEKQLIEVKNKIFKIEK